MVASPLLGRPFRVSRSGRILTERSVNKSYSYLLQGCRRNTFWVKPVAMRWIWWSA